MRKFFLIAAVVVSMAASFAQDAASFAPATAPAVTAPATVPSQTAAAVIVPVTAPPGSTVTVTTAPATSTSSAPSLWSYVLNTLWDARLEVMGAILAGLGLILDRQKATTRNAIITATSVGHSIFHALLDAGLVKPGNISNLENLFWDQFQAKYGATFNGTATGLQEDAAHNAFMTAVSDHLAGTKAA